jgi:hypothetical protein
LAIEKAIKHAEKRVIGKGKKSTTIAVRMFAAGPPTTMCRAGTVGGVSALRVRSLELLDAR